MLDETGQILRISEIEFSDIVVTTFEVNYKLRIMLMDNESGLKRDERSF